MFIHVPIDITITDEGWVFSVELKNFPVAEWDQFNANFLTSVMTGIPALTKSPEAITTIRDGSAFSTLLPQLNYSLEAFWNQVAGGNPPLASMSLIGLQDNRLSFEMLINVAVAIDIARRNQTASS